MVRLLQFAGRSDRGNSDEYVDKGGEAREGSDCLDNRWIRGAAFTLFCLSLM